MGDSPSSRSHQVVFSSREEECGPAPPRLRRGVTAAEGRDVTPSPNGNSSGSSSYATNAHQPESLPKSRSPSHQRGSLERPNSTAFTDDGRPAHTSREGGGPFLGGIFLHRHHRLVISSNHNRNLHWREKKTISYLDRPTKTQRRWLKFYWVIKKSTQLLVVFQKFRLLFHCQLTTKSTNQGQRSETICSSFFHSLTTSERRSTFFLLWRRFPRRFCCYTYLQQQTWMISIYFFELDKSRLYGKYLFFLGGWGVIYA